MRIFSFLIITLIAISTIIVAQEEPQFVGVKTCSMCHKKPDQGEQLKIWEESAHSKAYQTLLSEESNKIAADMGLGKAVEEEACLKCHATAFNVDAKLIGRRFKVEDGVQCETCHGAGSEYKSKKTMQDHAKSVAAGMTDFTEEGSIEKQCVSCHNEESPTFKPFNFEEQWAKIKHPVPAEK